MKILGFIAELIINILNNIWGFIWFRIPRGSEYDAKFERASKLLSRYNKGLMVTGNRALTIEQSLTHCLAVGGTSAGKTSSVLMNSVYNLIRYKKSLVILDASGEIEKATRAYAQKLDYEVVIINFANGSQSHGYNPLAFAKDFSEVQKICFLLMRNELGDKSHDKFWLLSGIQCLSVFAMLAKTLDIRYQHMYSAKYLLELFMINGEAIDFLVARSNNQTLVQEYKMLFSIEPKVLSSVVQTCRAALNAFSSESVQQVTSFNSISMEKLRSGKQIIYVQVPIQDLPFYSALISCMFEQMFGFLMSKLPNKKDSQTFFIMDEFAALFLPSAQIALSNLRKFGGSCQIFIQDINQLKAKYGEAETKAILTNTTTHIYFGNQPYDICKQLEEMAGKFEEVDKNGKVKVRSLISADHIRKLKKRRAIIFIKGCNPIFARMIPFFKHWKFKQYAKMSMSEMNFAKPFDRVPLPLVSLPIKNKTA